MSLVASERSDRYCPISETSSVSPETVRNVAAAKLQLYEETLHGLLNQQSPDQLSGLYDMPSYDAPFVHDTLGLRGGGIKDFSDIAKTSADHTAIRNAALKLGFLHKELDKKLEHSGRQLDVALPRDMQPIGGVSAIIVPGGAGATNGIRHSVLSRQYKKVKSTPQKLSSPPVTVQPLKQSASEPKHRVLKAIQLNLNYVLALQHPFWGTFLGKKAHSQLHTKVMI